jgi:hypothetical protein
MHLSGNPWKPERRHFMKFPAIFAVIYLAIFLVIFLAIY